MFDLDILILIATQTSNRWAGFKTSWLIYLNYGVESNWIKMISWIARIKKWTNIIACNDDGMQFNKVISHLTSKSDQSMLSPFTVTVTSPFKILIPDHTQADVLLTLLSSFRENIF